MTFFRALLDLIPLMRLRRAQAAIVDAEAISLIRSSADDEAAYQTAHKLMRMAREQDDRQATKLYSLVAVRIAEVTGRQIGKEIEGNRYGPPTRVVDGDRTRPVSRQ
jgi:hypothetical protein